MGFNVLVVDDSSVMRAMIAKTLRLSRIPLEGVHEAGNGSEGLAILGDREIDLALVDLNMPVMNGEEMILRMKQDPRMAKVPVIVVSTEGSFRRISLLRKQGADFVHKPFTPESLREAVADMTGGCENDDDAGEGAVQGGGPDF